MKKLCPRRHKTVADIRWIVILAWHAPEQGSQVIDQRGQRPQNCRKYGKCSKLVNWKFRRFLRELFTQNRRGFIRSPTCARVKLQEVRATEWGPSWDNVLKWRSERRVSIYDDSLSGKPIIGYQNSIHFGQLVSSFSKCNKLNGGYVLEKTPLSEEEESTDGLRFIWEAR